MRSCHVNHNFDYLNEITFKISSKKDWANNYIMYNFYLQMWHNNSLHINIEGKINWNNGNIYVKVKVFMTQQWILSTLRRKNYIFLFKGHQIWNAITSITVIRDKFKLLPGGTRKRDFAQYRIRISPAKKVPDSLE